jgi:hypothetical protein
MRASIVVVNHNYARFLLIGLLIICSHDHAAEQTGSSVIKVQDPVVPANLALPPLRHLPGNGLARTPPMGWPATINLDLPLMRN